MAFKLTHIRTGEDQLFTIQVLLEKLGDPINDEIIINGEAYRIASVQEDSSTGGGTVSSNWVRQSIEVTQSDQIEFEVDINTSDPEGLFLVVNGALFDYGQNGAFHIEGTTLFWHGRFNLSPTDQVYIKYLTLNS
ncbi:MAG: hypothetical protein KA736_00980 [Crocinitomicaceae bacterium]|nr:hypothetical protein [Crocinitomicaceae bacterium]MBP6032776.1 hypothetical protein [Crocinitomicaceae bacterium]